MHRETKRQILDLLTTLEEAISYLQRNPENNKEGLLRDCSLCAKSIVATLHKDSEAHEKHVHLLAQFTEKIKQAQKQIGDLHAFQQALSAAKVKLAFLRRKMEKLATKLEVVFLPYKASMWDSLESIWRAANADPDCDAYVVPIPYYDLNPDHTPAKFHYEGDLYPEDVPVTDYRKYDLPARRPDVIYIHNPYDGCNRVTSVEPAYYSDRLKKYTEMLVYVPYDVVMDGISEHMCQMPGVQNADRVIVQSEKIKQIYAKYMPEEKVLALGSPKIDKVLWTQEHPPAMPEEWAKIARGRKLVLYNTHLSPLIVDDGSVCRKLRYVFFIFKKCNDVCLLWRPHPLSEATMQAMNQKPLQEYLSLVEAYKHEQWGIYDDSPDVHRSIALSAAYYGDWSSLVPMYGITGKPVMIQHMEIYGEDYTEESYYLSFRAGIVVGNDIWFVPYSHNGLFKMNLQTEKVEFICRISKESFPMVFDCIVHFKDALYFIPGQGMEIIRFDLHSYSLSKYHLGKYSNRKWDHSRKFLWSFVCREFIWLIPSEGHVIVRFSPETGEMKCYDNWRQELRLRFGMSGMSGFSDAISIGSDIWAIVYQTQFVLHLNMETGSMEIHWIESNEGCYQNLTFDGENLWLLSVTNRKFIVWDIKKRKIEEYPIFEREKENGEGLYSCCLYQSGYVWLFPGREEKIAGFDVRLKKIGRWIEYPSKFFFFSTRRGYGAKFDGVLEWENKLFVLPYRANSLLIIDPKNGETRSICICKDEKNNAILYQEKYDGKWPLCYYLENIISSSLESYLRFIYRNKLLLNRKKNKWFYELDAVNEEIYGEKIHKNIENEMMS